MQMFTDTLFSKKFLENSVYQPLCWDIWRRISFVFSYSYNFHTNSTGHAIFVTHRVIKLYVAHDLNEQNTTSENMHGKKGEFLSGAGGCGTDETKKFIVFTFD